MRPFPLFALLLLAGCTAGQAGLPATAGTRRTVTDIQTASGTVSVTQMIEGNLRTATVPGTPDATWSALPAVFETLGVPVTMIDPRARLLGTTEHRVRRIGDARPSRYLDCGSGMAGEHANLYDVYITVVTQLHEAAAGATEVRTQLEAAAKDPGHGNNPVRCTSKGTLEKAIVAELQARLGGTGS